MRVRATNSLFTISEMTLHVQFARFHNRRCYRLQLFVVAGEDSEALDGRVEIGWGPTTLVPIALVIFPATGGGRGGRFVPLKVFSFGGRFRDKQCQKEEEEWVCQ